MIEIIKSYNSVEEYIRDQQSIARKNQIDILYKEAVENSLQQQINDDIVAEYCKKICDLECELEILEEAFIKSPTDILKKDVINYKRNLTKVKNELNNLIKEDAING